MFLRVWEEFRKSFKVKLPSHLGELKGQDYLGNKYFEIKADPAGGRRNPSRWFESKNEDDLTQDVPPEWMSWLRRQRTDPPTEEEIARNIALAQKKQENAAQKEREYVKNSVPNDSKSSGNPFSRHSQHN